MSKVSSFETMMIIMLKHKIFLTFIYFLTTLNPPYYIDLPISMLYLPSNRILVFLFVYIKPLISALPVCTIYYFFLNQSPYRPPLISLSLTQFQCYFLYHICSVFMRLTFLCS